MWLEISSLIGLGFYLLNEPIMLFEMTSNFRVASHTDAAYFGTLENLHDRIMIVFDWFERSVSLQFL
jgi:hypothetical protein